MLSVQPPSGCSSNRKQISKIKSIREERDRTGAWTAAGFLVEPQLKKLLQATGRNEEKTEMRLRGGGAECEGAWGSIV